MSKDDTPISDQIKRAVDFSVPMCRLIPQDDD